MPRAAHLHLLLLLCALAHGCCVQGRRLKVLSSLDGIIIGTGLQGAGEARVDSGVAGVLGGGGTFIFEGNPLFAAATGTQSAAAEGVNGAGGAGVQGGAAIISDDSGSSINGQGASGSFNFEGLGSGSSDTAITALTSATRSSGFSSVISKSKGTRSAGVSGSTRGSSTNAP